MESRLSELAASIEMLESGMAESEPALAEAENSCRTEEQETERAALQAGETRERLRVGETRAAEARTALAEAVGRLKVAREALESQGSDRRSQVESLTGWAGWVSQLLSVPSELAAAVEVGLERWAEAAAFEGPVALGNAVDRLGDQDGAGGPVSMVSCRFPGGLDSPARTVAASGSDVTPLVDLLGEDHQSVLAVRLLGDVVLVDDWRSGWEVVGNHPRLRAVTRRGDLITVRGVSLRGGTRLPDLDAAAAQAAEARNAWDVLEGEVDKLREEAKAQEESQEQVSAGLGRLRRMLLESRQRLDRQVARRREIDREKSRLMERRDSLVSADAARDVRLTELRERIDRLHRGRLDAATEAGLLAERLERASGPGWRPMRNTGCE